jgi:hypothetical protein
MPGWIAALFAGHAGDAGRRHWRNGERSASGERRSTRDRRALPPRHRHRRAGLAEYLERTLPKPGPLTPSQLENVRASGMTAINLTVGKPGSLAETVKEIGFWLDQIARRPIT